MVIKLHCKDFRIIQLCCSGAPNPLGGGNNSSNNFDGEESNSEEEEDSSSSSSSTNNDSKRNLKRQFIKIVDTITVFAFPKSGTNLFAFYYEAGLKDSKSGIDVGWKYADIEQDFRRMNLPSDKWRISTVNKDWELSPTYPDVIVVPNTITDKLLKKVPPPHTKIK